MTIFDGSDQRAMKIGEIYGNSDNREWRSISSTSKMMYIEIKKVYKPMNSADAKLPIAKLKALIKYNNFIPYCQNWLNQTNNTLRSPDANATNLNCSWLLSAKFGSYIILHIDHIHVSSNLKFDSLTNFPLFDKFDRHS